MPTLRYISVFVWHSFVDPKFAKTKGRNQKPRSMSHSAGHTDTDDSEDENVSVVPPYSTQRTQSVLSSGVRRSIKSNDTQIHKLSKQTSSKFSSQFTTSDDESSNEPGDLPSGGMHDVRFICTLSAEAVCAFPLCFLI